MSRARAILVVAFLLPWCAGAPGTARGNAGKPARPAPDPAEVLSAVNRAMAGVSSLRLRLEVAVRLDSQQEDPVIDLRMTTNGRPGGDSTSTGSMSLRLEGFSGTFQVEAREVDGIEYLRNPVTGEWEIRAAGESESAFDAIVDDVLQGRIALVNLRASREDLEDRLGFLLEGSPERHPAGRMTLWADAAGLRVRHGSLEGMFPPEKMESFLPPGTAEVHMKAVFRIEAFDEPTEVTPPIAVLPGPAGPMRLYQGQTAPIAFEYPATWSEMPPREGVTASYASPDGGLLLIAEEDLLASGFGETTLAEYTDLAVSILEEQTKGFELLSREPRTTRHQVTAQQLTIALQGGMLRATRFLYVHAGRVGVNVTFLAPRARFEELAPVIRQSLDSFRVVE